MNKSKEPHVFCKQGKQIATFHQFNEYISLQNGALDKFKGPIQLVDCPPFLQRGNVCDFFCDASVRRF